ncbi:MAG: LysR family transcriptional regulator [Acidihalobacter sp.]
MELSQLKMFKAVVDQGSIAKASEILHCVPSNITSRIKLLEQDLGVELFMRKGRGLVITPSGEIFQPSSEPSGVLRIGAIETAATGRLPAVLSKFHQDYPAVQMQFSTGTWQQLVSDVADHKLDGAIVATKSDHPDISYLNIHRESLVLIASPFAGNISPEGVMTRPRPFRMKSSTPKSCSRSFILLVMFEGTQCNFRTVQDDRRYKGL